MPRVDVGEQTSLKGKVEEMIKITKRFLKECFVILFLMPVEGCILDLPLWMQPGHR